MFTQDEIFWLYDGIPMNSSTMSKAVPHQKLRELFDFKAQCAVSAEVITRLQAEIERRKNLVLELHPDSKKERKGEK